MHRVDLLRRLWPVISVAPWYSRQLRYRPPAGQESTTLTRLPRPRQEPSGFLSLSSPLPLAPLTRGEVRVRNALWELEKRGL